MSEINWLLALLVLKAKIVFVQLLMQQPVAVLGPDQEEAVPPVLLQPPPSFVTTHDFLQI